MPRERANADTVFVLYIFVLSRRNESDLSSNAAVLPLGLALLWRQNETIADDIYVAYICTVCALYVYIFGCFAGKMIESISLY